MPRYCSLHVIKSSSADRDVRTKLFSCSTHLHLCCANVLLRRLKILWKRWVAQNSISKRNSTEKGCSYTREETNISTAHGLRIYFRTIQTAVRFD
jgi:hypothetical protein